MTVRALPWSSLLDREKHIPGPTEEESVNEEVKRSPAENIHEALGQYAKTLPKKTLSEVSPPTSKRPQSPRMAIKAKGKILFIDPTELISVHAEGNYVLLQKRAGSYLLRASISKMVSTLERYGFIRIHRSLLVNKLFVEEMQPYATGNYGLRVRGGRIYTVSRTYKKNLKSLADAWIGTDSFVGE